MEKTKKHGGANRGQGRKAKDGKMQQFRSSKDVEEILQNPQKFGCKDKTELIETAIRKYVKQ